MKIQTNIAKKIYKIIAFLHTIIQLYAKMEYNILLNPKDHFFFNALQAIVHTQILLSGLGSKLG